MAPVTLETHTKTEAQHGLPNANLHSPTASIIHQDETETPVQHFGIFSLAGIGLVVGNTWPALGGSILTSIYNGGAPGVLYEFIAASLCYCCIAATLCELASALPSSSGVYLWASVSPGARYGRIVGYFAGWWNCLAWMLAVASMAFIASNLCVQMYGYQHPEFSPQSWHIFVCFLAVTWISTAVVCLGNAIVPLLNVAGMALVLLGAIVTIVVCTVSISTVHGGGTAASSTTVWTDWQADIGYPDGFVFVAGMLNASYAMGAADAVSHLAEEIPHPARNVPRAVAMQYVLGFVTGFAYLVAVLYCITDYEAVATSSFPIAAVYAQVTGGASNSTTVGLLTLILLPTLLSIVGCLVTSGRCLWTLARDGATPMPAIFGRLNARLGVPLAATIATAVLVSLLGVIYIGSSTAFNAFIGAFVLLSTASYMAAAVPYTIRCRGHPDFTPGSFYMRGPLGWVVVAWACLYMPAWFVIYCFPYTLPTDAQSMNYSMLIWSGLTIFVAIWWFACARKECRQPTLRVIEGR